MSRYKAYAEYKDSGVEWIGEIPNDWDMWKITHACPYVASGTTPKSDGDIYYGGETLWVTTGELREGLIFDTQKKVTDKALIDMSTLRLHPEGSVAIAMYGATIGRLGIFGKAATTNQACCVMPPSKILQNKYLFYWLFATRQEIINLSSGGGQPNVNQEKIASLKVSSPTYDQQEKIANFLDHETAKIDTLIAKQQGLIKLLEEKRQAVISHAVTKGLNPNAPMRDSGVEWLGEVPAHLDQLKMKHILIAIIDAEHKTAEYFDDGTYLVCRTTNVRDGILKLDGGKYTNQETYLEWIKRGVPEPGDILFTREAPAGEACIVPEEPILCLGQRMVLFKLNKSRMNPQFVLYSIYSGLADDFIKQLSQGSTVSHMNMADIINIPLFETALEEQKEIVEHLNRVLARYDELQKNAERTIELIQERRTALISAAVTGKIDVRGWEEPRQPALEVEDAVA